MACVTAGSLARGEACGRGESGSSMTLTIAVSSQKGGVGKTTTAANLGVAWGGAGSRVLLVDLDPQFALTRSFGVAPSQAPATVFDVLRGEKELTEAVIADVTAGVDLVASHR